MNPHEALSRYFGLSSFRPGQEPAIDHVLAGHDTLVVMPTGWGKSLIYQLAALMQPGTALVISPLVALMKDQVDALARHDIPAAFINSSLDASEQSRRLSALAAEKYKIVLVAPERLHNQAFLSALRAATINLLAVDEAHCISQWGHDFRPDYLHIADVRSLMDGGTVPTSPLYPVDLAGRTGQARMPLLALTATATPRVQDDIIRRLGMAKAERIVMSFDRPNLTFEVFSTYDQAAKFRFIRDFLTSDDAPEGAPPVDAGIIYTATRGDAEELARRIREELQIDARHYHGSLDSDTRTEVQDAFLAGDLPVVVATNAFGMGIDRPDVRFVMHYTMPGTLEAYYQEAGRAGRDGLPARAILLYSPKDTGVHKLFIENAWPDEADLHDVHALLQRRPEVSLAGIHDETGVDETKVRVALEQLEVAGAIRRRPDGPRGQLRVEVFPLSDAGLRTVAAQTAERRGDRLEQLGRMVAYAETNACRRRVILDHFGDHSASEAPLCCDNCLTLQQTIGAHPEPVEGHPELRPEPAEGIVEGPVGGGVAPRAVVELTQPQRAALIMLDTLATLPWEVGRGKLAQLLKGSQAKDMSMAGYARNRNFGKFAGLRASEIDMLITQLIDGGYLKQVGDFRPTLKLTPRGEGALKARVPIDVQLRTVRHDEAQRQKAQRAAGGTVAYTGQLLAAGHTPEQIAAERTLSVGTIYSHLAQLIAVGQVQIDQVVPADVQQQVRAAIQAVGSAEHLAPIKMRLPEEIDYGVIRCVANAWLRERGGVLSSSVNGQGGGSNGPSRASQVYALGESGSLENVPELIAALADPDGNVRRLAASALGKLKARDAVEPLLRLLRAETFSQVRQYAIKALGSIGDERARGALKQIADDETEKDYNRISAKAALSTLSKTP